MPALHGTLASLAVAATLALLGIAIVTATGRLRSRRAVDRTLLVQLAVSLLAAAAGVAWLVMAGPPRDALHLLYGALVVGAPLAARAAAGARDTRRLGRWVAVGAIVAIAAAMRSFMTGN